MIIRGTLEHMWKTMSSKYFIQECNVQSCSPMDLLNLTNSFDNTTDNTRTAEKRTRTIKRLKENLKTQMKENAKLKVEEGDSNYWSPYAVRYELNKLENCKIQFNSDISYLKRSHQEKINDLRKYLKQGITCPIWNEWEYIQSDGHFRKRTDKCSNKIESRKCVTDYCSNDD